MGKTTLVLGIVNLLLQWPAVSAYSCSPDGGLWNQRCGKTDLEDLVSLHAEAKAYEWLRASHSARAYTQREALDNFGIGLPDNEFWRLRVAQAKQGHADLYFYHELEVGEGEDYSSLVSNMFIVSYRDDNWGRQHAMFVFDYWPKRDTDDKWDYCECSPA